MKAFIAFSISLIPLIGLIAQPEITTRFNFRIVLDSLSFKHKTCDLKLKIIKGKNLSFYSSQRFYKNNFKEDTLQFQIKTDHRYDTLVFDLIKTKSDQKMKIAIVNFEFFNLYNFNLSNFYNGVLYFDMKEIQESIATSSDLSAIWNKCVVWKNLISTNVEVNNIEVGNPNGLMYYSWKMASGKASFYNYYQDLPRNAFFKYYFRKELNKTVLYKSDSVLYGNSDTVIFKYHTKENRRQKKNYNHSYASYVFYQDHTFKAEISNIETDFASSFPFIIGVWEQENDILTLNTPINWISTFDSDAEMNICRNERYKVKRNKLTPLDTSYRALFKQKKE